MNLKVIFLFCGGLFWLAACGRDNSSLPTRVPTAAPLISLPLTNTPFTSEIELETPHAANATDSMVDDATEVDAILQEIDLEVCQQVFQTRAELDVLQEQGKDVTELATAVAELVVELAYCESLLTPTPTN
ncbi:MAG: hypothetical protein KJ069_09315 [Anaerolineae bacterium]|nr:hypothetical protein [Anaerolineae bacterium]